MTTVKKIGRAIEAILVVIAAVLAIWYFFLRNTSTLSTIENLAFPDFASTPILYVLENFDPEGEWSADPEDYNDYRDEGYAVITCTGTCDVNDVYGNNRNAEFSFDMSMTPHGEDEDYVEIQSITIDGWTFSNDSSYLVDIINVIYQEEFTADLLVNNPESLIGISAITFAQKDKLTTNWIAEADGLDPSANASEPSDEYIEQNEAGNVTDDQWDQEITTPAWQDSYMPYDLDCYDRTRYYTFYMDHYVGPNQEYAGYSHYEIAITQMDSNNPGLVHVTMKANTDDYQWTIADDYGAYFIESPKCLVVTTNTGYQYQVYFTDDLSEISVLQYTIHGVDDPEWKDPLMQIDSATFTETTEPTLF